MDSPSVTLDGWDDLDFDDDDDDEPFPPLGDRVLSVATGSATRIDSETDDSPEWPSSPTTAATTVATPSIFGVAPTPGIPSPKPAAQLQASSVPTLGGTMRMADSPILSTGAASHTLAQPPAAIAALATVGAPQVHTSIVEASSQALHCIDKVGVGIRVSSSSQGMQPETSTGSSPCPAPHSQRPSTQVQDPQASVLQSPPAIPPRTAAIFTVSPASFASRPLNQAQSPTGDPRQVDDSLVYFDSFGSGEDDGGGGNGNTINWKTTLDCGTAELSVPHVPAPVHSAVPISTPSRPPHPEPVPSQQLAADMAITSFAGAVPEGVGMRRPYTEVPPAAASGHGDLPNSEPGLSSSTGPNVTPHGGANIREEILGEILPDAKRTAAELPSGATIPPPLPHTQHADDDPAWREVSFSSSPFLAASSISGSSGAVSFAAPTADGKDISFELLPPPRKVSVGFELPGAGAAGDDRAGGQELFSTFSPRATQQVANEQLLPSTSVPAAAVQSPQGTFIALGAAGAMSSHQAEGEACSGLTGTCLPSGPQIVAALGVASAPLPPPLRSGSGTGMLSRTPSHRHRLSLSTSFREREVDQGLRSDMDAGPYSTGKGLEPIQSAGTASDENLPDPARSAALIRCGDGTTGPPSAVLPSAPPTTGGALPCVSDFASGDAALSLPPSAELAPWTSAASGALSATVAGGTAAAMQPSAFKFTGADSEETLSGQDTGKEDLVTGTFDAVIDSSLDADLAQALAAAGGMGGGSGAGAALRARPGMSQLYRTSIASSATATPSELAAFDDAFDELMAESFDTDTEPRPLLSPRQQQQQQQKFSFSNRVDAGGSVPLSNGFYIAARNPFGPSDSGQLAPGDAEDIFKSLALASPAGTEPTAGVQGQHELLQYTVASGSHANLSHLFGAPSSVSEPGADDSGGVARVTSGALGLTQFREGSRPLFDSPLPSPRGPVDPAEAASASARAANPPEAALTPAPVTTYREVAGGVSALFGGKAGHDDYDVFGASHGAHSPDSAAAAVPTAPGAQGQRQQENQQHFSLSSAPTPSFPGASGQAGWAQQVGHGQQPFASVLQQHGLQQPQWQYGGGIHPGSATGAADEASSFFDSLAAASGPAPATDGIIMFAGDTLSVLLDNNRTLVHTPAATTALVGPAPTAMVLAAGIPQAPAADEGSAFFDSLGELQPTAPASVPAAPSGIKAQEQWGQAPPAFEQSAAATPWHVSQPLPQHQVQDQAQMRQEQTQNQQLSPLGAIQAQQQQALGRHSAAPLFQAPGSGRPSAARYDNAIVPHNDDGVDFFDRPGTDEGVELTSGAAAAVAGAPAETLTPLSPRSDVQQVMPTQLAEQQGTVTPPLPPQQKQPQEQPSPQQLQPMPLFGQQSPSEALARGFDGSDFFDNLPDSSEADEANGKSAAVQQINQQQEQQPPVASASGVAATKDPTASAAQTEYIRQGTAPYSNWTGQQQTTAYPGHAQQQPYNMPGYGANSAQQQPSASSQHGYGYAWQSASQQPTYGIGYMHYNGEAQGQPRWQLQTGAHPAQSQQIPTNPPQHQTQALAHTSNGGVAAPAPPSTAALAAQAAAAATSDSATATAGATEGGPVPHQIASVFTDGSTQARVQYDIAASRSLPSPDLAYEDRSASAHGASPGSPSAARRQGHEKGQMHVGSEAQGTSPNPQAQSQGQPQARGQDGHAGPQQTQGAGVGPSAAAAAAAMPEQQPLSSERAAHQLDQAQVAVGQQQTALAGRAPVPEETELEQEQHHGQGREAAVAKGPAEGSGDIAAVDSVKAVSSEAVMTEEEVQAAAVASAASAWEAAGGYSLKDASDMYQRYYAYYYYYYQQQQQVQKQQLEQRQRARQQADNQEQQKEGAAQQQTKPQEPREAQEHQQQQGREQEQLPAAAFRASSEQPDPPPVADQPWTTTTDQDQSQRQIPQPEGSSPADHKHHLHQQHHHHQHPDHHYHHPYQHTHHYHQQHDQTHQSAKQHHHHHQQHNYEPAQAPAAALPQGQPMPPPSQQQHATAWPGSATAGAPYAGQQPGHSQPQPVPGAQVSSSNSPWAHYQQASQQQTGAFHLPGTYGQPGANAGDASYGQQSGYGGASIGPKHDQSYGHGSQHSYGGYVHHPMNPGTLYGSGMYTQQQHGMQRAQVNYLPTTPDLARTCPHGRPTHVVFAFGFGGRALLMRPPSPATDTATMAVFGTPGPLHLVAMAALTPAHLCGSSQPAASSSTTTASAATKGDKRGPRGAQGASSTPVFEHLLRHFAAFPGPLGPSTSKDKVLKWLGDHAAACSAEDGARAPPHSDTQAAGGTGGAGGGSAPSVGSTIAAQSRLLWEVLRLMVKHSETGKAKQSWGWLAGQAKDDSSMESELLKLLVKQRLRTHPQHQHQQSQQQTSHASGLAAAAGGLLQSAAAAAVAAAAAATGGTHSSGSAGVGGGAKIAETTGAVAGGSNRGPEADGDDEDEDEALQGNHAVGGPPVLAAGTSEAVQQAAAKRMQRLLVLGRKAEALKVATEAGLWGPALLLATAVSSDGRAFQEVAVAMAQSLLLPGTPVRTLALVVAGRPDLVHAAPDEATNAASSAAAPATAASNPARGVSGGGLPPSPFGPAAAMTPSQPAPLMPPAGFYNPMAAANTVAAGGPNSGGGASAIVRASIGGDDGAPASSSRILGAWREHLAILLTTRGPADSSEAVVRLGDRLRTEASQVLAAHICYSLSSYPPSLPDATDFRYSLLGAATAAVLQHPLADGSLALQRTEVLEWLVLRQAASAPGGGGTTVGSSSGAAAGGGNIAEAQQLQMWALLPFKLLHAWELVEYGKISEALQYCAAVEGVLRTGGVPLTPPGGQAPALQQQQNGRLPGGAWLHMTELQLRRLQDRLMHFAQANAINLQQRSESTISKVGRFLDGTINKLLWGGEQVDGTAMAGGGSTASAAGGATTGAGTTGVADGVAPGTRPAGPQVVMGGPSVQAMGMGLVSSSLLDHQPHPQGPMGPGVQSGAAYAGEPTSADGCNMHSASVADLTAAADGGANASWYGSNITGSVPAPPPPRASFTGATVLPAPRSMPGGTLPGYGYEASMGSGFGSGGNGMGPIAAGGGNVPDAEVAPLQPRQQPLGHRRIVSAMDLPPYSLGQLLQLPGQAGGEPPPMSASASGISPVTAGASGGFGDKGKTDGKKQAAGGAKGSSSKDPGSPPSRSKSSTRWLVNPLRLLGGRKGGNGGADGDGPKKGSLGEENQFYYDETRKRWVMRGQEDAVVEEDKPQAPPTTLGWAAASAANGPSGPGPQGATSSGPSPYTTPPSSIPGGSAGDLVNSSLMAGPTSATMTTQLFQRGKGIHARYVNTFGGGGGGGLMSSASSSALHSAATSPPSTFFVPPPPPPLRPSEVEAVAQANGGSLASKGGGGQSYGGASDQPDQRGQQQQQQQSLQQPLQTLPSAVQTQQQPLQQQQQQQQQQYFLAFGQDQPAASTAWVLQPPQSQPLSTLPLATAQQQQQLSSGQYQDPFSGSVGHVSHDGNVAAGTGVGSVKSQQQLHPGEAGGSQNAASASAPAASYSMPYDVVSGQVSQASHLQVQGLQDTSSSVHSTWMTSHPQQSMWPPAAQASPHPHPYPSSQPPLPQEQQELQQVSPPASMQMVLQKQVPPGKSDSSNPPAWPPPPPLVSETCHPQQQALQQQGGYASGTLLSPNSAQLVHGMQQRLFSPTSLHPMQQSLPKAQSQHQPEGQEQRGSTGGAFKAPPPMLWQQQQQQQQQQHQQPPVHLAPQQAPSAPLSQPQEPPQPQIFPPAQPHPPQQAQDLVSHAQQQGGWRNTHQQATAAPLHPQPQQPQPQQQTTTLTPHAREPTGPGDTQVTFESMLQSSHSQTSMMQQVPTSRAVTSHGGSAGGTLPAPQSPPAAGQPTTAVVDDLLGYGTMGMYERGSASMGQQVLGYPSMRSQAEGVAAVYDYASVGPSMYDPYASYGAYSIAYSRVDGGSYGIGAAASGQGGFSGGDGDLREVEL